ncbi:MAG: AIPR family protein [Stagnimonas sp.]|nr:AIPR family protein [Stagnimonas sp.]
MPTRDEKVSEIEAALRKRFFQHVPKVETPSRQTWTDEQHDIDRLSRAIAAYSLVGECEVDDATAASAITDGSNDGGIDSLYFDRANGRLLIVQAKFKRTGAAPSQEETLKTINGIKALLARRFGEFNQAIQNRLDEIEEALDKPGTKVEVILAFLGDQVGPHVTNDLNALRTDFNGFDEVLNWKAVGLELIHAWLVAEQTPANIEAQITLTNWAHVTTPRRAIYGQITAASLAALVVEHGKSLFERNIRHYLGSVGVNTAIEKTVRSRPEEFFYLNNGITATASEITPALGGPDPRTFRLKNVSIVNGAQTAGAIANAALAGAISDDAKLLITVIQVGDSEDTIGMKVTKARNHQNTVRGVDFAALDPNQEQLRRSLAMVGITYHYRPSAEARARRDDAFTLEEAAIALACWSQPILTGIAAYRLRGSQKVNNAIGFVVIAKREVGRLWEQDGELYGQLFTADLSGIRVSRMVRLYRFVDQILADTETSQTQYSRRMFFRHGRYFTMAFVAHASKDIINRNELALSPADRLSISQRVNEMAELIYAQSQRLSLEAGFLSVFRNLSDAQPLAESVLVELNSSAGATAPPVAGPRAPEPAAPIAPESAAEALAAVEAPTLTAHTNGANP